MIVNAGSEKTGVAVGVLRAARAEIIDDFVFRFAGRDGQRPVEAHFRWKIREQIVEGARTDGIEHLAALGIRLWKVSQLPF